MIIGDHLAVFSNNRWRHGILVSHREVVTLEPVIDESEDRLIQVNLNEFSGNHPVHLIQSELAFGRPEVAGRALQVLRGSTKQRFHGDSEFFAKWCRSRCSVNSAELARRTVQRELNTVEIENPLLRRLIQMVSVTDVEDATAIYSRLAMPWLTIGDTTECAARLVTSFASANPRDKDQANAASEFDSSDNPRYCENLQRMQKKMGAGLGAASATALGGAVGGPTMALTTLASWLLTKRRSDNTIERIKDGVATKKSGH